MKKVTKSVLFVLLLIIVGFTGCHLTRPSLIRGITSEISEQDAEFERRVLKKFPQGTSHAEIKKELERQGFKIRETDENKALSYYETSTIACETQWYINWYFGDVNQIDITKVGNSVTCL
ncbi:MAG: hypothetical protein AAF383_11610 [Cyanobacteria bacterium P01_A01_bin.83]